MGPTYFTPNFGGGQDFFDIECIGDGNFLRMILEGVAMFTNSGTFTGAIAVLALLGVLGVIVAGIINGGRSVDYHKVFIGLLIVFCFFQTTTKVGITDRYTGYVAIVDNVPLGVALAGFAISKIGSSVEEQMKLAFQSEGEGGKGKYLESLQAIMKVREMSEKDVLWEALNREVCGESADSCNVDLKRSWSNYMTDCFGTALDVGGVPTSHVFTKDFLSTLKYEGVAVFTRIYVDPSAATGEELSCADAYIEINSAMDFDNTNINQILNSQLSMLISVDQATGKEVFENGLDMLTKGNVSAQTYMKNAVLYPIFLQSMGDRSNTTDDTNASIMINQAIEQRNTEWTAGQTLFQSIVRPLMAFIEGFSYAFLPFIAFVVVLGSQGIQASLKYFMMLMWIQMWGPCMAIIDLFVTMSATNGMQALQGASASDGAVNFAWGSAYVLDSLNREVQSWIGIGGFMASSVPALAMAVLFGGGNAMAAMSSLSGPSKMDSQVASPSLANSPSVASFGSSFESKVPGQGNRSGMPEVKLNVGEGIGASVASAEENAVEASQNFAKKIGNAVRSDRVTSQQLSEVGSIEHASGVSNTEIVQAATNFADSVTKGHKISSADRQELVGAAVMAATAQAQGSINAKEAAAFLMDHGSRILSKALGNNVAQQVVSKTVGAAAAALTGVVTKNPVWTGAAYTGAEQGTKKAMDFMAGRLANVPTSKGAKNGGSGSGTDKTDKSTGKPISKMGVGGSLNAGSQATDSTGSSKETSASTDTTSMEGSSGGTSNSSAKTTGVNARHGSAEQTATTSSQGEVASDELSKAAQQVVAAKESYRQEAKRQSELGAKFDMDATKMAQNIVMNSNAFQAMDRAWGSFQGSMTREDSRILNEAVGEKARMYMAAYNMTEGAASTTARLMAMSSHAVAGNEAAQNGLSGVAGALTGMEVSRPVKFGADAYRGMVDEGAEVKAAAADARKQAEAGAGDKPEAVNVDPAGKYEDGKEQAMAAGNKNDAEIVNKQAQGRLNSSDEQMGQSIASMKASVGHVNGLAVKGMSALSDSVAQEMQSDESKFAQASEGLTPGQITVMKAVMNGDEDLKNSGIAMMQSELKELEPGRSQEFVSAFTESITSTLNGKRGEGFDRVLHSTRNFNEQAETYTDAKSQLDKGDEEGGANGQGTQPK